MIREDRIPQMTSADRSEALEEAPPKLRFINKALEFLHSAPRGEKPPRPEDHWNKLYKKVSPWESGIELSDNIRAAVYDFAQKKVPQVKGKAQSIADLPKKKLLDALVHNWFEDVQEETGGQRREVLLAVMAHVLNKIETVAWQKTLQQTDENGLRKLGLDPETRDLLVGVLDVVSTADQLFIRFLAYAQLSEKPPKEAPPGGVFLPRDAQPHSIGELFPKETQYLANNLSQLAANNASWVGKSGGKEFMALLESLGRFYQAATVDQAGQLLEEVKQRYLAVVTSEFPILVTPAFEGYYKEPYLDPELRVSLMSNEARQEDQLFQRAKVALAENFRVIGAERFADAVRTRPSRGVLSVGSYGVNLVFKAVAQEDPATVLYLDEQLRVYDRGFPALAGTIEQTPKAFASLPEDRRRALLERMSRMNTMLHEFGHPVYPDGSPEAGRLGATPLTSIDEVKAEMIYRGILPELIAAGAIEGTKEQWAIAALGGSLQQLKDNVPGDPYYHAAAYPLNRLVEAGVVVVEKDHVAITDTDKFFAILNHGAHEVLSLYEDPSMTELRANQWLKTRCSENKDLKRLQALLKKH